MPVLPYFVAYVRPGWNGRFWALIFSITAETADVWVRKHVYQEKLTYSTFRNRYLSRRNLLLRTFKCLKNVQKTVVETWYWNKEFGVRIFEKSHKRLLFSLFSFGESYCSTLYLLILLIFVIVITCLFRSEILISLFIFCLYKKNYT